MQRNVDDRTRSSCCAWSGYVSSLALAKIHKRPAHPPLQFRVNRPRIEFVRGHVLTVRNPGQIRYFLYILKLFCMAW